MNNISITLTKEVLNKYKKQHSVFIETGTYLGGSISLALECGFDLIYSIDISESHKERNYNIFKNDISSGKVKLLYGDSIDVLPSIINNIDQPSIFWLDAHFDIFSDVCGKYKTPILYELESISKSNINTHTIIIDDVRIYKNNIEWNTSIKFDDILYKLKNINKNYTFSFEDGRDDENFRKNDILVAHI